MEAATNDLTVAVFPQGKISEERLAVFFAMIAGYIDVVGYSHLKTYVSFMSGNTTQVGLAISHGDPGNAFAPATAIISFVLGIYAGNCLSLLEMTNPKRKLIWIVAGLLGAYMLIAYVANVPVAISVLWLSFCVGLANTVIGTVGQLSVNTSFITGTLNSFARQLAEASVHRKNVEKRLHAIDALYFLILWLGFLCGAIVCGFLSPYLKTWSLTLPTILLLVAPCVWRTYFSSDREMVE
jgi:uncharacterized membrane protein YoaK (UPF0700 family)